MQATREGRFKAVIGDVGISEKNSMCSIAMRFDLVSELTADGWRDIESEKMSILGYFYLTTKDGSLNEFVIKNFREVLMWNGRDIEHIRTARGAEVQVTLAKEEYNGKVSLKVKYMNSADYEGGVSHDESAVKKFQSQLGAKLRANAGGTSAPAVNKAAESKPADKPKNTPPPVAPPAASGFPWENTESDIDTVWARFVEKFPNLPAESQGRGWTDLINRVLPGTTDANTLTPRQWGMVLAELESADFKAAV